jgi:Leucine-rich repeat (LRR) protein
VTHLNLSGSNVGLAEDGSADGPLPEWVYAFKLKELILADCGKLNELDVARFPSLETLDIDGTQLLNWKFVFIKCGGRKNLKTISARNLPALGDLPEELAQCTSLESLDVSGCNFTTFPKIFTDKALARGLKLKTLVMTNNKIKTLPDGLKYLESIETMNFQCNDIKQVDMDIGSDLPNLKRVDLTKNPLKKVPPPVWKKKEEGIVLVDGDVKEGLNVDDVKEMAQDKAQEAKKMAQEKAQEAKKMAQEKAQEAKKAAQKAMGSIKKMF